MSFNLHRDRGGGARGWAGGPGWAWARPGQTAPGGNLIGDFWGGLGVGASAGGCPEARGPPRSLRHSGLLGLAGVLGTERLVLCNQNTATSTFADVPQQEGACLPALSSEDTSYGPGRPWPAVLGVWGPPCLQSPQELQGCQAPVPGGGPAGGLHSLAFPSRIHTPSLLGNPARASSRGRRAALRPACLWPRPTWRCHHSRQRSTAHAMPWHRGPSGATGSLGQGGGQGWGHPGQS